jgi:uncharacterized protein (DUF305 family)
MKFRTPTAVAAAAASLLLLAACSSVSGSSGHDMSGMGASASTAPAGTFNKQDVLFGRMMTAHHLQAVQMADIVLKKPGVTSRVTDLAKQIKGEQTPQIATLNGWLTSWGEKPVKSAMSDMSDMEGDGMMNDDQMNALANATGSKVSSLFLTQMVQHHAGALTMAQSEITAGKDPRAIALAKSIISTQVGQIDAMKKLLAGL